MEAALTYALFSMVGFAGEDDRMISTPPTSPIDQPQRDKPTEVGLAPSLGFEPVSTCSSPFRIVNPTTPRIKLGAEESAAAMAQLVLDI
jgi:hypothetical protein